MVALDVVEEEQDMEAVVGNTVVFPHGEDVCDADMDTNSVGNVAGIVSLLVPLVEDNIAGMAGLASCEVVSGCMVYHDVSGAAA